MLRYNIKIKNELSQRTVDDNGYVNVLKSPILKSGILEYYGAELLGDEQTHIDGVLVDPDKLYKVYISEEELKKGADSFRMKPLINGHTWLGDDGDDAKDYQEGSLGENWNIENGMLYFPLLFTGSGIIGSLDEGTEELSASYYNRFVKSDRDDADFEALDIKGNHVALVENGRCGNSVKVLNSKKENTMAKQKSNNEDLKLMVGNTEVDLNEFIKEESKEGDHDDSITENEDKRAIIDEIGGILKGKVDDEVIREIMAKAEKLSYEGSEDSKSDNEEADEEESKSENEDKEEEMAKAENRIATRIQNAIASQEALKVKAYNEASAIVGDFNAFGLSANQMYVKALNELGVETSGKEKTSELSLMLKACNSISRVDNSFSYTPSGVEEIELNI